MTTSTISLTNSDRLRATISLVLPEMMGSATALWEHPRLPEVYPRFLRMMHGVIRASVPLMEVALECTRNRAAHDPVAAGMSAYFVKHIPEERGHDDWLLQDLQVLGIDPSSASACCGRNGGAPCLPLPCLSPPRPAPAARPRVIPGG